MTRQELQTFMLKNRLSVEAFYRKVGYSPRIIRDFLKGIKKVPEHFTLEYLDKKINTSD